MAKIREELDIDAPAARVWKVVHEDLKNAPKWSTNLVKAEVVGGGPPKKGSILLYHLWLPGNTKETLELEQTTWTPPKKCAGRFKGGPLKGSWSYIYKEKDGETTVLYEMDYELGGVLRFLGGMLKGQYESGIRKTLRSLKQYVESGKGPKA